MLDYRNIKKLVSYGVRTGMISSDDKAWAVNQLLDVLCIDSYEDPGDIDDPIDLPSVLCALCDCALETGALTENSIVY
ncbi:MAG: galactose-1-phosphate uridylyltransferase, partial [Clostridia bacterium]|nr:galactose-1-phosphate uridylyltransferase [Clostridia bacterium]